MKARHRRNGRQSEREAPSRAGAEGESEDLAGRVAVVTGASRGVGRAVALALAREGARVVATARDGGRLEELSREADSLSIFPADLTDEGQVRELFRRVREEWGRLDLLVNCAGLFLARATAETSLAQWHEVLSTNLTAVFLTCREALAVMVPARRGTIVNFSSVGGRIGLAGKPAYCASKFGVVGLSRALAKEVRPHRIKVHVLYPYVVDSGGSVDWDREPDRTDILAREDVVRTVLFLARLPARVMIPDIELNPLRA